MAAISNPTFQKANLGLPNANTPFIVGQTPSQIAQAWMMFFLQMSNAIAGNGAALEGAVQGIDDVVDLRTQTSSSLTAQIIYVAGYYTEGDGGEGIFLQGPTATDNGGTIINDASGRSWYRQLSGTQISIRAFGAKCDGTTDDSTMVQNALTWMGTMGGGLVTVPVAVINTNTTTAFSIPFGVTLQGEARGPWNIDGNPLTAAGCPRFLLVLNTAGIFMSMTGDGAGIEDIAWYYPNQVTWASGSPTIYAQTVQISHATGTRGSIGCHVRRCTAINAYHWLDIQTARYWVEDCLVGALGYGINIDHSEDYGFINNVMMVPGWDQFPTGAPAFPTPLDVWCASNSYGMIIRRQDAIQASNLGFFCHYAGIAFLDTQVAGGLTPSAGYGQFTNIDIDTCQYGVLAQSINSTGGGAIFSNLNIGGIPTGSISGASAQAAIALPTGGIDTPLVSWNGGGVRGTWAAGAVPTIVQTGTLFAQNVRGLDPFGDLGSLTPAMISSGGNQVNTFPFRVRVHIESNPAGPITHITINGTACGANNTLVILDPGEAVGLTYTSAPVWVWFGL